MSAMIKALLRPLYRMVYLPVYDRIHYAFFKIGVKKKRRTIKNKIANGIKIDVCFFMQFPEMWNSEKTVFDSLVLDQRFNATVVTIPKKKKMDSGKKILFDSEIESYEYCVNNHIKAIKGRSGNKWFNLKKNKFDYIFIQRPYDEFMPKQYKLKKLSSYALVCHIPYGFDFTNTHIEISYGGRPFLNNFYNFYADSFITANYVKNRQKRAFRDKVKNAYDIGFPRFDLIEIIKEPVTPKRFVWTPRWSLSADNDKGHFLDYFETLFNYFSGSPELELVIRPHPLMFTNFLSLGIMTQYDVDEIKKRVDESNNITFDNNSDYNITFSNCDAMISDFSSLMIEFFISGKPIIYCGEFINWNEIGDFMRPWLYAISSPIDLVNCVASISRGDDTKFGDRIKAIETFSSSNKKVGERIKDTLLDI